MKHTCVPVGVDDGRRRKGVGRFEERFYVRTVGFTVYGGFGTVAPGHHHASQRVVRGARYLVKADDGWDVFVIDTDVERAVSGEILREHCHRQNSVIVGAVSLKSARRLANPVVISETVQ